MRAYLDTSAILKLLIRSERGVGEIHEIVGAAEALLTSRVAHPESRAALAAARRSGRLTRARYARARERSARILEQIGVVELTAPLANLAGDVAERYGLRALDAIHLASALAGDAGDTVMVTWDRKLGAAAREAGLNLAPANG